MKHTLFITITLALLFLASHAMGLVIIDEYLPKTLSTGEIVERELPLNIERPEVREETSFIPIFFIILFATIIALLFIKFQLFKLWKLWFFISIALTLIIAFSAFINQVYAIILGIVLALMKLFKPSTIMNNLIEIFIYGGLAAIFVPIFNLLSISILLILISIYDAYSVLKSKHMIKLAKFQTKAKVFTGLSIPYQFKKEKRTMLSLLVLLFYGKKGKFYPAMPILTMGCFLGYLTVKFILF
ncbi:hypothetical protein J4213_03830 [Candidatus Woesearchaeota archaeon]|nr:hypothetical protein [Candidatus Woesearchaeota archaeon]